MGDDPLYEKLQQFVGRGEGQPSVARDRVNVPMIRHWTDAIGDRNPVYVDEDAAASSIHGGIVAPPTMLQAWGMRGLDPSLPSASAAGNANTGPQDLLQAEGYRSVVATNCEQIYHRYLRPGDLVTITPTLDEISPKKVTALGTGYFVTNRTTYRDEAGDTVAEMLFRVFWYDPSRKKGGDAPKPKAEDKPKPAYPQDSAFFWEGLDAGELRIQRCASCGALRHPPRPMCPSCRSTDADFVVASGKGGVYSFVVHHHPPVPGREHPFVVGLIQLDEGTRIVGNIVDVEPADVSIGMPVEVSIEPDHTGRVLPLWRPA